MQYAACVPLRPPSFPRSTMAGGRRARSRLPFAQPVALWNTCVQLTCVHALPAPCVLQPSHPDLASIVMDAIPQRLPHIAFVVLRLFAHVTEKPRTSCE